MRIAIISSNLFKIPPDRAHAVQWITSVLVENLVKRGHQVTLFGPGNSKTSGKLYSLLPASLDEIEAIDWRRQGEHLAFDTALTVEAFKKASEFDLFQISLGTWDNLVWLAHFTDKPVVVTLHDPLTSPHFKVLAPLLNKIPNLYFVSISDSQRRPVPELNYAATVYHGLDISLFHPNSGGDYLGWIGRLSPEKGLDDAITVAKTTGMPLKIAALIWPWKRQFWQENFARKVDGKQIQLIEEVTHSKKDFFYQKMKALLFPILWEEPFGLVMLEAMATGTPVIAYARGSVPEIVVDGQTGFIVPPEGPSLSDLSHLGNLVVKKVGIEGLVEAVGRINSMSEEEYRKMRFSCRRHVEENFTLEKMVDGYEAVYQQILHKSPR